MTTLLEAARRLEDQDQSLEVPNAPEASDRIHEAITTARRATSIDVGNATLKALPGYTAGLFHRGSTQIELEEDLLLDRDPNVFAHVAVHEAWHKANQQRSDGVAVADNGFNEGLTELATAETTGNTRAYAAEVSKVSTIASRAGTTRNNLVRLFQRGDNKEINKIRQTSLAA